MVHLEGKEASGLTVDAKMIPTRMKTKKSFCFTSLSKTACSERKSNCFSKAILYCNVPLCHYCNMYYSLLFCSFQIDYLALCGETTFTSFSVSILITSSFMSFASSAFQQMTGEAVQRTSRKVEGPFVTSPKTLVMSQILKP